MLQNSGTYPHHSHGRGHKSPGEHGAGTVGGIIAVVVVVLLVMTTWLWINRNNADQNTPNPANSTSASTSTPTTVPGGNTGITNLPGGGAVSQASSVASAVTSQAEQQLN